MKMQVVKAYMVMEDTVLEVTLMEDTVLEGTVMDMARDTDQAITINQSMFIMAMNVVVDWAGVGVEVGEEDGVVDMAGESKILYLLITLENYPAFQNHLFNTFYK